MNNLEKYLDRVIAQRSVNQQRPVNVEVPVIPSNFDSDAGATFNIMEVIRRRWYIVLLTSLILCAAGIPAIWLLIERAYTVTGAIRVAPVLTSIVTGEEKKFGGTQVYQGLMYTQAERIKSSQVVQRVATDLAEKKLAFFENPPGKLITRLTRRLGSEKGKPDEAAVLNEAILDEVITAGPARRGNLIMVSMKSTNHTEATKIVDAFIKSYMVVEVTSIEQEEKRKLALLEDQQGLYEKKLQTDRTTINELAKEYGSKQLDSRYDMNLQRIGKLWATLTEVEARRIYLQTQVRVLEQTEEETIPVQEMVQMREEYINKDPGVGALTTNIMTLDQGLIIAKETLAETNPEITRKTKVLEALRARLEEQKDKVGKAFDELMKKEIANASNKKLLNLKELLKQTQAHEQELRELLDKEDTETIELGKTNLAMQELQDELNLTKEMHDRISRRIEEFKIERKRDARISVFDYAKIAEVRDKRVKYMIALIFGSMACGVLLAVLREKADHSVHTPDEVAKRIGIRIIGTTTSIHTIKPAQLAERVAGEYQTIRANLDLFNGGGIPKSIVITSPGVREGKTTFAINLATSMSGTGKRVLLIDGDMRKPDIASLLGLPIESRGLQDFLFGTKDIDKAVCSTPSNGLHVLAADSRNTTDAFELLASSLTAQRMNEISQRYDHVIIDTPPVLAFADALIWAKVADGVILTSFAGQTTASDLKEAKERLAEINDVRVLGTILSNVEVGHSYYRYGYNYYARNARSKRSVKRARRKMLLPMQTRKDNTNRS